jgi:predicted Holliday junction resolvase-like endonuclease
VSTGTIIAIVIGAIVLVTLLTVAVIAIRRARLGNRRHQARELHRQARGRTIQVEAAQASADRHAAHARRAEAEAEEKSAEARHDRLWRNRRATRSSSRLRSRETIMTALAPSTPTRATQGKRRRTS